MASKHKENTFEITLTVSGPKQLPRDFLCGLLQAKLTELGFKAHWGEHPPAAWTDAQLQEVAPRFFSPIKIVSSHQGPQSRTRYLAFMSSFESAARSADNTRGYHILRKVHAGEIDGVDYASFVQEARQRGVVTTEYIRSCHAVSSFFPGKAV